MNAIRFRLTGKETEGNHSYLGIPARFIWTIAYIVMILSLVADSIGAQELPAFQTSVNFVNVTAVARSRQGQLMTDLQQEDFEILEDGVPQKIEFFARHAELPLSLGLIVDVSGSQEHFLKQHNRDIEVFLQMVLRPSDQAFAVCFGNHLRLVASFSSSIPGIMNGIQRFAKGDRSFPELGPAENRDLGAAFYDAVFFSISEKLRSAPLQRRALILFSDGEDNSSEHDLLDSIEEAQSNDTPVDSIRYTHPEHGKLTPRNRYGMRVMKHIASQTGAADFDGVAMSLPQIFVQIGDELRSMYQFGYSSNNGQAEKGFRKLIIRSRRPDAIIRTRSGYYLR